jgi:hypothetical protein
LIRVIVGADLRSLLNRVRSMPARSRWGLFLAAPVASIPVLVFVGLVGASLASGNTADPTGALGLLFTTYAGLALVLVAGLVITLMFTDRNLLLLAVTPVPTVAIAVARLVLLVGANAVVGIACWIALLGFGVRVGAPPLFWIGSLILVPAMSVATAALQTLVFCLVLRVVPAGRARDASVMVSSLVTVLVYLSQYLLRGNLATAPAASTFTRVDLAPDGLSGIQACVPGTVQLFRVGYRCQVAAGAPASTTVAIGEPVSLVPTGWPGRSLGLLLRGDDAGAALWLGLTAALVVVLCAAMLAVYRRVFVTGITVFTEAPRRTVRRSWRGRASVDAHVDTASVVWALVAKDWRTWRRDVRRLAGIAPAALYSLLYPFILFRGTDTSAGGAGFWTVMAPTLLGPMMLSTVIGGSAVPSEGRAFNVLRLAPLTTATVMRAKVVAAGIPTAVLCVVLAGVAGAIHQGDAGRLLLVCAFAAWLGVGLSAIAVGTGAISPRFDAKNTGRQTGAAASFAMVGGDLLFLLISVGGFAALIVGAPVLSGVGTGLLSAVDVALAAVALAVAATIPAIFLAVGTHRLATWQPPEQAVLGYGRS